LEKELSILKLKESIEKEYGDIGRTQYIIEKLQIDASLPKSDQTYIERMIKLCIPEIEVQVKTPEIILDIDLIKCNQCNLLIKLDEKSIRKNNFWFHDKCFEEIPVVKTQVSQKIVAPPKVQRQPVMAIPKSTYSQMIFSGGLLATLVGTTYFLLGEMISSIVGIWGGVLYFAVFKSQILPKKKQDISVVKTGIPGFDSALSIGLKKNSSVVVSGPPGSGKTTFGLQFIYSGANEFNEPGVYISLSQSIDEIKKDCRSFGWDIDSLIAKEKILMIDLRPFKIKDKVIGKDDSLYRGEQIPFEHLTKFILNCIKKINAKRIVIDSISILGMQYSDKFYMRQGLQGMIQSLENFDVTSLLISEFSENNETPIEWFVTSGIIQLDNQIIDNKMKRTIKITKLRGIEHSEQVHSLELGSNGLYVYEN
jgi:circadian clock protein KaiC